MIEEESKVSGSQDAAKFFEWSV